MPLKTPEFWYRPPGLCAYALLPLAWLYQIGHRTYQHFTNNPYKADIPVICIGNSIAGGGGKTPTAISLMNTLIVDGRFKTPCFLTRAYGGEVKTTFFVDDKKHNFSEIGDEAFLLAKVAPTIASPHRAEGAKFAQKHGMDIIIMDDGLQNNSLSKDITFLVIDRAIDFGNGKTIPAGPMREPLTRILPKVDAVITIGRALQSDKPVFEASISPAIKKIEGKYIAFAGLARPKKFLHTLEDLNANLVGWHEFADHHLYTKFEIDTLLNEAKEQDAMLITTEKDHVRLPKSIKEQVKTLPIALNFNDDSIVTYIKKRLNK